VQRVGVVDGAIGDSARFASLAALFPHVTFESAGPRWPDQADSRLDGMIVTVDASSSSEVEGAVRRLANQGPSHRIIIVLLNADVTTTRRLVREGAADVLPGPVSEPSLASSLERLLVHVAATAEAARPTGEVVAFLKAGGGVGATALATQLACLLTGRVSKLCVADLDLQFGAAGLYLDLPDAATIIDCLGTGGAIGETSFAGLAKHRSGARLLAAPRELTPLEALTPSQIDDLVLALRRDFALTMVDLPSVWTAWTNRLLQLADRIVLVTQLTVPHIHLVKRQLNMLSVQRLDDRPRLIVCNGLSADQQASLSLKAAERALGRAFDLVLPEDRRTMNAAINQGVPLSAIRRGTKLEKALVGLGELVVAGAVTEIGRARR
jgi:pilus assembly protein CpaE